LPIGIACLLLNFTQLRCSTGHLYASCDGLCLAFLSYWGWHCTAGGRKTILLLRRMVTLQPLLVKLVIPRYDVGTFLLSRSDIVAHSYWSVSLGSDKSQTFISGDPSFVSGFLTRFVGGDSSLHFLQSTTSCRSAASCRAAFLNPLSFDLGNLFACLTSINSCFLSPDWFVGLRFRYTIFLDFLSPDVCSFGSALLPWSSISTPRFLTVVPFPEFEWFYTHYSSS
jgi:hypothetical protein